MEFEFKAEEFTRAWTWAAASSKGDRGSLFFGELGNCLLAYAVLRESLDVEGLNIELRDGLGYLKITRTSAEQGERFIAAVPLPLVEEWRRRLAARPKRD